MIEAPHLVVDGLSRLAVSNNVLSTEDALNRAQNLIAEVGYRPITAVAAVNQALGGGMAHPDDVAMQARR